LQQTSDACGKHSITQLQQEQLEKLVALEKASIQNHPEALTIAQVQVIFFFPLSISAYYLPKP